MGIVNVSNLKPGEKLMDEVVTKRGGLLLEKGRLISSREIEILKAFMIVTVSVEKKNEDEEEEATVEADKPGYQPFVSFEVEYNSMISFLRQVFKLARSGGTLPILDIRLKLEGLVKLIDQYNVLTFSAKNLRVTDYMYHNSILVALTSYQLARWSGSPTRDLMPIALAGLFHDIGNVKVDEALFEKKSRLTPNDIQELRQHAMLGYQLLKNVPAINEGVKLCALQHHEREDGSGYPMGVSSDKIHYYAKVVAVADIFHAMTSNRHHKNAESPYLVLEQILNESFGKLSPTLVQTFISRVTSFHNGMVVKLSDNRVGEIVFSDRSQPTRPWVNVQGTIINLTVVRHLYIKEVIKGM